MSADSVTTSDARTRLIAAISVVAALALSVRYAAKFWSDRIAETTRSPFLGGTFGDLRDATWLPVRSLLAGDDPYDTAAHLQQFPYAQDFPTYLPAHLALWLPLGPLDWNAAMAAYLVVSILVVAAVGSWGGVRALREWTGLPVSRAALVAAAGTGVVALWLARTVTAAVGPGQPSVVYALVAAPAVLGVRRAWLAVVLVALTCLKPQVGLTVVLVLLAQRRWRLAAGGVALAGGVSLVVAVVLADGFDGLLAWTGTFLRNVQTSSTVRVGALTVEERVDLEASLLDLGVQPGSVVLGALAVVGLLLVYVAVRWSERRGLRATGAVLGFGVALLPIYHISYDASWLLVPLALGVAELHRRGWLWSVAPGLAALAVATWVARWHGFDILFGTGTGVVVQRFLLVAGLLALAGALVVADRSGTARRGDLPAGAVRTH